MAQTEREKACPCHHFRSIESVADALESPERTSLLISWLSGECQNFCGTYNCSNRVETSLTILNAVRDACRTFLEGTKTNQTTTLYEESFPALSVKSKNTSTMTAKNSLGGSHKRRIRPATLAPASNASAWGVSKGNLVDLPSEEPLGMPTQKQFAKAFKSETLGSTSNNFSFESTNAFVTPEKSGAHRWEGDRPPQPVFATYANEDFSEAISLRNLIDVYAALIDSCLVPSTPLELHLLFRLLILPNQTKPGPLPTSPLGTILCDNSACVYFARESLERQGKVILGLGPVVWQPLVRCPSIQDAIPDLYDECDRLLREFEEDHMVHGAVTNNQTALLALPFDEERDSRHNYRSPHDQAIYANREATRDAFLYQLRSFLSVRGKVLDAAQVDKALLSIQRSSRSVIEGLVETNLTWFSHFFVDLLLQIGLVPLQETDKELLQIADKDKLQKLHQRFSQAASRSRSSSHKVAADPARSSNSPRSEALNHFPGHQEFFFVFILSADSYSFALHLRRVIINKIIATINEDELAERKLMEVCMLARYVGLLFFSPNWRSYGTTNEHQSADPALDAMLQLKGCGLCIISTLESALSNNKLSLTVSWITELLQMSSWDISAMKSKTYVEVLSILRQLQKHMANEAAGSSGCHKIIALSIESFFSSVTGISTASKLAPRTLPQITSRSKTMDKFTANPPSAQFSCIAHLEDLTSLLSMISRTKTGTTKSPGVSRKLRPSMLGNVTSPSPRKIKEYNQDRRPEEALKTKLRDGFFHRQPEMKLICEFVVPRLLRKLRVEELEKEIDVEMRSRCLSLSEVGSSEFQESLLVAYCKDMIRKRLEDDLQKSLEVLSPEQLDRRILFVATSLGVEYGIEISDSITQQIVANQKVIRMKLAADDGKVLFPGDVKSPDRNRNAAELIERCIEVVGSLSRVLSDPLTLGQAVSLLENATKAIQILSRESGTDIPPEDSLRKLLVAFFELDKVSSDVIDHALSSDEDNGNRWQIVSCYLSLAAEIQCWSHHGLGVLKRRCTEVETLCAIIAVGITDASSTQVAGLSSRMTKTKIWKPALVEASLRKLCEQGIEEASRILASYSNTQI